jgi:hypothetical protein
MRRSKILSILSCVLLLGVLGAKKQDCVTIQDGVLTYSAGHYLADQPLMTGYDPYGYNYQAHMFNGSYANIYLGRYGFPPYEGDDAAFYQRLIDEGISGTPASWYWDYRDVEVVMKWNDAWLSNKDCGTQINEGAYTDPYTPDGSLDRHYGFDSYVGSGAWETNHQFGEYMDGDGKTQKWNYFVKIVAVPEDAVQDSGVWYDANGTEIGPDIWGQFAVIQEVYNDTGTGDHGILYKSPAGPGLGMYAP